MSEEFENENENDSEGIKSIRKELKEIKAARTAELLELEEFRKGKKLATIGDKLKSKGANPGLSEFYNSDDFSDEAVEKWLESKKDLFNYTPPATNEETAEEKQARRIAASSHSNEVGSVTQSPEGLTLGDIEEIEWSLRNRTRAENIALGYLNPATAKG